MSHVSGPTSSMPGSIRPLNDGSMCDDHPKVLAVARVQGETDSMGAEFIDMCQSCLDSFRSEVTAAREDPEQNMGWCDWCGTGPSKLRPRRDYDEGSCGPVYRVCGPCIEKAYQEDDSYHDHAYQEDDSYHDHDHDHNHDEDF